MTLKRGARVVEVRVRTGCPRAEAAHRRARRQYAHTGHAAGVVCVARAFWQLPKRHQRGILFHELGHLALRRRPHSEAEADRAALECYGVQIRYRDTRWGERLQYV